MIQFVSPMETCYFPGLDNRKAQLMSPGGTPQFVLETLRIIDTGQTRESLRERDALQFCPITLPVRPTAQVPSAGGFQLH